MEWCTRLEIGAGGGLVGLAVANGCSLSQPLHITDQLEMLTLMGHNVLLNNAQGRVKPMVLNWCVHTSRRLPPDYHSLSLPAYRRQIPETILSIGYDGNMQCHILLPYRVPASAWLTTTKIQQGRAIAVGNDRVQAGCDPGCRLCLL